MSLRLYNQLTRSMESFLPADPPRVRLYVCGLTPSGEAHLGHARSFIFFDVLRRYLVHLGYRVTYARNVTDVDDRSIATANAEGISFQTIIARHLESFERSMRRLHVIDPDHEPRATHHIDDIVAMIASLVERGHAYVARDGVYYAVATFERYGALAGRDTAQLLAGARIEPGEDKRDPLDFALWKFHRPGEPEWSSPWGAGRPGWHIECSAMCHALLGEPLDIHGGGYDLVFPHHENEIAQSEPLYGAPLARFWVHGGLLVFDGKKMSKSIGNFEPLYALLERHDPQAIRFLFLQTGYRKPLNFTESSIDGASTGLRRLHAAYDLLRTVPPAEDGHGDGVTPRSGAIGSLESDKRRFFEALDDDLNTSGAVATLFDVVAQAQALVEAGSAGPTAAFLHEALALLGISPSERTQRAPTMSLRPDFIAALCGQIGDVVAFNGTATPEDAIAAVIEARDAARKAKNFALADRLRGALAENGVALRDSREGVTWSVGA